MRGRRVVRVAFVVVVMSASLAGSAIAISPGPVQFPLVAELQGTVRDLCTGLKVSGFVASVSDPTDASGALESPSKTTGSGFVFQNIHPPNPNKPPSPNLVLHVGAPGYAPLGDPASPNPGVPITVNPGPINRVTKQPGPNGLPGETRVYEGVNLAIALMPTAGCAGAPHAPKVNALAGKVFDLSTGTSVSGLTVGLAPEPNTGAVNPGPSQVGNGSFKELSLVCGSYNLTVQAAGFQPLGPGTADVVEQGCGAPLGTAQMAWGNTVEVVLAPVGYNQAPVIDWTTASAYALHVGDAVALNAAAHDPDPNDNSLLTYQWSETGAPCSFTDGTSLATDLTCAGSGSGYVTLTVSDPHGATTTDSFTLVVLTSPTTSTSTTSTSTTSTSTTSTSTTTTTTVACLSHPNGLGGSYIDCAPLGVPGNAATYTQTMATEAANSAASVISGSVFVASCPASGAQVVVVQNATKAATWQYTGANAGHVVLNTANNSALCPSNTDPTWQ